MSLEGADEEQSSRAAEGLLVLSRAPSPASAPASPPPGAFWRAAGPGPPGAALFLACVDAPLASAAPALPAPQLRDPALFGPNPRPALGTLAVPPPPEIMANEASSLVNRRIELALLHNEVQAAQILLVDAKAAAAAGGSGGIGSGGGGGSGGGARPPPLLERLLPDPAFQSACASVGVPAATFEKGGAGAGGEREEVDLIKKLAQVLTQMKMERVQGHTYGTRANKL